MLNDLRDKRHVPERTKKEYPPGYFEAIQESFGHRKIEIETIKRLRVSHGDIVILKSKQHISQYDADRTSEWTRKFISNVVGFSVEVLLLPDDMDVEVMGPDNAESNMIAFDY